MIFAATASFFLAVVLGLTLVVLGMRYRRGSLALAVAHVVAALVGLALLLRHIADSATQRLYNLSAFLFVLALLGNVQLWMAVLADVGAALLVTLNGLRLLNARLGTTKS